MTRTVDAREMAATTLANARRALVDSIAASGHWEGELSSSALSTATACFALWSWERAGVSSPDRAQCSELVQRGLRWLAAHQNADGGFGDTPQSRSNISTTALCWAALVAGKDEAARHAESRAAAWLQNAAGSLDPEALCSILAERYGKDRTFSVPILTMCALAGRLGDDAHAWRHVPQLPFELAALPQSWFRFLGLPVVSYALPALIAIGQVRHSRAAVACPVTRWVRRLSVGRTLRVLRSIQPRGGGFLEATPLTSFVVMSLVGAGRASHPVVTDGVHFLLRSARADGSWPIDTNLATWVTTLSINAIAAGGSVHDWLSPEQIAAVRAWLLQQQYRRRHAYTGADPGAWAWTDLPGGVPDADDTAGALIALHHLGNADRAEIDAASAAVNWLLNIQNSDGGIPTFCRGWGKLPFDRSAPEITAHALLAWDLWRDRLPRALERKVDRAARRAMAYLQSHQRADGSWLPLWFGNESAPDELNPTHGTARVLIAQSGVRWEYSSAKSMIEKGVHFLLTAQNLDGGWGGAPGVQPSIEETAQAVQALAMVAGNAMRRSHGVDGPRYLSAIVSALQKGIEWLSAHTKGGVEFPPAPLGLYFARLWYWERLYPLINVTAALGCALRLPDRPGIT